MSKLPQLLPDQKADVQRGSPEWWATLPVQAYVNEALYGDVTALAGLSSYDKAVASAVAKRMNADGMCFASVEDISARAGCSIRKAQSCLMELTRGREPLFQRVRGGVNPKTGRRHNAYVYRLDRSARVPTQPGEVPSARLHTAKQRPGVLVRFSANLNQHDVPVDTGTLDCAEPAPSADEGSP